MLLLLNKLSAQLGDEYIRIADNYKKNSKPDSALIFYKKASLEFQDLASVEKLMNAYNQVGVIYTRKDEYDSSALYLKRSLAKRPFLADTNNLTLATTYISLGVMYGAQDNIERSLFYHNKALAIRI